MKKQTRKVVKLAFHWILVAYLAVYLLTGLGIIYWQQIEPVTLGLLGKANAMRIHDNMHIPFAILLVIHVYLGLIMKEKKSDHQ